MLVEEGALQELDASAAQNAGKMLAKTGQKMAEAVDFHGIFYRKMVV